MINLNWKASNHKKERHIFYVENISKQGKNHESYNPNQLETKHYEINGYKKVITTLAQLNIT